MRHPAAGAVAERERQRGERLLDRAHGHAPRAAGAPGGRGRRGLTGGGRRRPLSGTRHAAGPVGRQTTGVAWSGGTPGRTRTVTPRPPPDSWFFSWVCSGVELRGTMLLHSWTGPRRRSPLLSAQQGRSAPVLCQQARWARPFEQDAVQVYDMLWPFRCVSRLVAENVLKYLLTELPNRIVYLFMVRIRTREHTHVDEMHVTNHEGSVVVLITNDVF